MARVIAINLLLIFLPLIIYSAFIILYKQPEHKDEFWSLIPLKKLFFMGFLAMGIFYFTQVNYNKTIKDGVYHPATIKDGKVIPGYISPPVSKPETKPVKNTKLKPDTQPGQNTPAQKQADPAENTQAKTQPKPQSKPEYKPQSNTEATPEKDNKPDTDQKKQQDLDEKQI